MSASLAHIIYVFIGAFAGIIGGLLGISGGVICVPALYLTFYFIGFPHNDLMQLAIGTSLAAMIFNAISSSWAHYKRHGVVWPIVKQMVPGIVLGSLCGALIADVLSSRILEIIFGIFACLLGIYFWLPKKDVEIDHPLPHWTALNILGVVIAALSNILGIGGGTFIVPSLLYFKVPERKAIGTAAPLGFVITLFGAAAYLFFGMGELPVPYTLGYIYIPAFVIVSVVSFFAAPYGAMLTQKTSPIMLRRFFGCALIAVGIIMFFL